MKTDGELAEEYFKKENPHLAEDEYYLKDLPNKSMTYRAALWGLRMGAQREREKLQRQKED